MLSSGPESGARSASSRASRAACQRACVCRSSSCARVAAMLAASCSLLSIAPELQAEHGLAQLLPRAVEPLPSRALVVAGDRLGALGAGDLAINRILQRQHALPGQLAAGARLGDLAPVAVEQRQRQADVERKLVDAVVPVVARRRA